MGGKRPMFLAMDTLPLRYLVSQHALVGVIALGVAGGLFYLWIQDRLSRLKPGPVLVRVARRGARRR